MIRPGGPRPAHWKEWTCETDGCWNLLSSILEQAISDLKVPEYRVRTLSWVRRGNDDPFSFIWISWTLGLDPDDIRRRIERIACDKGCDTTSKGQKKGVTESP